jgi:hypothetical protein
MKTFMGIIIVLGFIISFFGLKIGPDVKDCSAKVQNAARGLLIFGIILFSVSLTFMICGCGEKIENTSLSISFVLFMLVFGVITFSLSLIIHTGCGKAKKDTPFVLTLSVIIILMSLKYLIYNVNYSINISSGF